ncbi:MAG: hypothetical protein WBB23_21485 [Desulforhopalus sp.]
MEDQLSLPSLRLSVNPDALPLFTTVLQSGIEIKTTRGETLAKFLNRFPGFTAEYLADTVQTIFLDGTAVDDLSLQMTGNTPVLALSAAMPGLAGAIFRKNSFHSALRSETKSLDLKTGQDDSIVVTLKLFNSIATERGEEFLQTGLCMRGDRLANFLTKRPHLIEQIQNIQLEEKELGHQELLGILPELAKVNLNIVRIDG